MPWERDGEVEFRPWVTYMEGGRQQHKVSECLGSGLSCRRAGNPLHDFPLHPPALPAGHVSPLFIF